MKKSIIFTLAFVCIVSLACSINIPFDRTIKGSGQVTSEIRPVSGFIDVVLQTVGVVTITIGEEDSVVVEAEDNILPLLKTEVTGSRLLISMRTNTKISVRNPVRYTITMRRLDNASISGTGDIKVYGLDSDLVKFDLPGTGSITANGNVRTLKVGLAGTGFIVCDGLEADSVVANLDGSGEITVKAGQTLDADITGVGTINYHGDPTNVTTTITGYGSINKLP